jgi:hypothetical protein
MFLINDSIVLSVGRLKKEIMGSKLLMRIWEERIKDTLISNCTSLH